MVQAADKTRASTHLRMSDRAIRVENGADRVVARVDGERFGVLFDRVDVARGVEGVVAGLLECRDARDAVEERAAKKRCARGERLFVFSEPMLRPVTRSRLGEARRGTHSRPSILRISASALASLALFSASSRSPR